MRINLEIPSAEEIEVIKEFYKDRTPSDILRELLIYTFDYEHDNNFKTSTFDRDTLKRLDEVLYWWEKSNAQLRRDKEFYKDKLSTKDYEEYYKNHVEI